MTDPDGSSSCTTTILLTSYDLGYGTLSSVRRVAELPCEHAV